MTADLIIVVLIWLVLFVYQLANEVNLCNGHKALTSCQKQVHDSRMHDEQWSRSVGSELTY